MAPGGRQEGRRGRQARPPDGPLPPGRRPREGRASSRPTWACRTPRPLLDLGVGWSDWHGGWAFPASDAAGRLIGISVRHRDGRKRLVAGSRNGLFLPWTLARRDPALPLIVCEGASDAAAAMALGGEAVRAVGRPNWACGDDLLLALLNRLNPAGDANVTVVGDNDAGGDGRRGALALARTLRPAAARVRVVLPPAGVKDLRAWLAAGLAAAGFAALLDAA